MSRFELQLSEELAGYIGSALSVGNDEDAGSEEFDAAEALSNKLLDVGPGNRVRIIVESIE